MQQLLGLLKVDRDMLSAWFTRWQQQGLTGLADLARSGHPVKWEPELKKNSSSSRRGLGQWQTLRGRVESSPQLG